MRTGYNIREGSLELERRRNLVADRPVCFNTGVVHPSIPAKEANVALSQAVEDFRSESFVDCYDDVVTIPDLVNPDLAMGNCDVVAIMFQRFLVERGIEAEVVYTDDSSEWGYLPTTRHGLPAEHGSEHYAVVAEGQLIDWTASQFRGESDLPVVKGDPR